MKKKLLAATLMAAMTITTVFGGSAVLAADDAASTKVITDSMGNEVEVPTEIKSMAILPMPWISVVYALNGSGDIITGMQQVAKNSYETSMLKKLAPELEDTNTTFFADGEFNYEELAKINPDVVMLFESQSKHIDKLKEVGIPAFTIKYADSYDTLWNDFSIIGNVLSKEERAQEFVDYQKADVQYFEDRAADLENLDDVKSFFQYHSGINWCRIFTDSQYTDGTFRLNVIDNLVNGYGRSIATHTLKSMIQQQVFRDL